MRMKKIILWVLALALLAPAGAWAAPLARTIQGSARSESVRATGLQLLPAKATLYVGSDGAGAGIALVAKVLPQGASPLLKFSSSKASVATVDELGYVTPRKAGSCVITCQTTDGSKLKRTLRITVKPQPPTALALESSAMDMTLGTSRPIKYVLAPANAVDKRVTWKSSKPSVAKVSATGQVTAVKAGSAVITCKTRTGAIAATMAVNVGYAQTDIYYVSIGQSDYLSENKLPAAFDDAKRFAATIESCDFGHKSMTGSTYFNLTGAQLSRVLAQLPAMGMDENDVTYIYYSGHGLGSSSQSIRGALAGVDFNNSRGTYITVDQVREYLDQVPGTVVVVLDCCLAGQYIAAKGTGASQAQADRAANDFVDAFKGPSATAKGTNSLISGNANKDKYKIIAACKSLEQSYMGISSQYSVFTRFICEGAGVTGADKGEIVVGNNLPADGNKDGLVSLAEIKKYCAPKIFKAVKQLRNEPQNMVVWPANDSFPIFGRLG